MNKTTHSLSILLFAVLTVPIHAGQYPFPGTAAAPVQAFNYPDNTITFNDGPGAGGAGGTTFASSVVGTSFGKVTGNATTDTNKPYLQLTNKSFGSTYSSWRFPTLDASAAIQSFDASFSVRMIRNTFTAPGAGFSLNFGPIPATGFGSGDLGFTMPNGIVIGFDTYADTANDKPSIQVYCNNTIVGDFPATNFTETTTITSGTFTLTNPVTGVTTGNINYNATASAVQTAMRGVPGWTTVTVTGSAGNWTVNHNVVGSYADPVGNGAGLANTTLMGPSQGVVVIANTQDGTASQNEIWTIALQGRGFVYSAAFKPVTIHWDYNGLDVSYNGQVIFTDLPTPGFVPAIGHQFAVCASTVGGAQDTYIDDFSLATTPASPPDTGGPVISEFMAENASGLEDEEMDHPDWIEIYNGQNVATNLGGYKLSNGVATWTFPSVSVAAYGHVVVFASGKNRTANIALLHTNFTLPKTGGTVTLKNPSDTVVSEYIYPNQIEDYSYGLKYQGGAVGFLDTASPGSPSLYSFTVAPHGPAEDVVFSRDGGLISGTVTLSVAAPVAPNSVVRYTLDNTPPNPASPIFPASLTVSTTTNVRARVYTPDYLPGPVSSRTFLLLDASLTNYNSSNQPFKSHLPLIFLDSFGVPVDSITSSSQLRPFRYTYSVVINKDATGWASVASPTYDFQGRAATHVRGESSSGFPQLSYAWELWDNNNNDKDASILGFPEESDWVLYGPYTDKTLMRNLLVFQKMRELHGGVDGYAMRTQFVEVFFNQNSGQPISYSNYRGVYVLMEKIKRNKDRIGIAKLNELATDPALISGGYIFKRDKISADGNTGLAVSMQAAEPEHLNSAQATYLNNYINSFNNALNGGNFTDPVQGYAPYINRDSFIENQWFVEIAKQIDGYRLSTYFYKERNTPQIRASPLWDYNLSLSNADYLTGDNPTGWYYSQLGAGDYYWWPRLLQDPNYLIRHWDRYWEMRRTIFATPGILSFIDQQAAIVLNNSTTPVSNSMTLGAGQPATAENAAMRQFRKYPILGAYVWPNSPGYQTRTFFNSNGNSTTGEVDWMKNWLATRLAWIDDQFSSGGVIYRPPNFSNNGGNVPSGTTLTITPYNGTPPGGYSYAPLGTIYYTTDGSDPRPSSSGGSPGEVVMFDAGVQCKWLVPSAGNGGSALTAGAGAQQWTTYTDPPNIGNWTSSTTGVGYERDPASATSYAGLLGANSNTESQMYNINSTCYIRITFNIANQTVLDAINTLKLAMKYDDGFRAYINGTLVAGRNDTDASLTTDPSTAQANQIHDDAAALIFEDMDITVVGKPALRIGTNVLAIHGLNSPSTSSDLLFIPRLSYIPPGGGGGGGNGFAYSGPITISNSQTIKARLLYNGVWTPMTSAQFISNAVPADSSNLVVSEIMYNPLPASLQEIAAGYGDKDFEYIELQNISAGNVDLSGCKFVEGISFDFNSSDFDNLTLPPGARIVVVGSTAGFTARYGNIPSLRKAGEFTGSLSNQGEMITLTGKTGQIIAQFTYGSHGEWPDDADGNGYSLVLNIPSGALDYNNPASWRSSAVQNGTPGTENFTAFTGSATDDIDGDGYSNYLEYAMGSNPASNQSHFLPKLDLATYTVNSVPGTYVRFIFRRNLAGDGFTAKPELSTDLVNWNSGADAVTFVGSINNGDGTANFEYRSTQPASALQKASMRLKVTSQP